MKPKLNRPLIVFDVESTGVVVGKDCIIELYMLRIDPDYTEHEFYQMINPQIHIPEETTAIHGIKDEDVADKPTFKEIANKLLQFIGNSDLAGYNSNKFDIPILVEEFYKAGITFDYSKRKFLDVMGIFHKMEPRNLRAAYKFYCGKAIENAHTASADTKATWEILQAQLDRYENMEVVDDTGNTSIPIVNDMDVLCSFSKTSRNVDLVGHIVYDKNNDTVLNFGKHKGKKVSEVFKIEPSYYDWMMKSQFPESTKAVITKIYLENKLNTK